MRNPQEWLCIWLSLDFLPPIEERNRFGGVYPRNALDIHTILYLQVQRVEEDDQVLALVVRQADLLEGSIDHGHSFESRSLLLDLGSHFYDKYSLGSLKVELDRICGQQLSNHRGIDTTRGPGTSLEI